MDNIKSGRGRGQNIDDMLGHSTTVIDQKNNNIDLLTFLEKTPKIVGDNGGRQGLISQSGEQIVGFRNDDISINFQYGISTMDIDSGGEFTGTGQVGTVGAVAYAETGTGVGSATLTSVDSIRYRSGHSCYADPSVVLPEPEANVNMYVGFLNGDDGWCWGYRGLDLVIWFIEGGNVSWINRADWDDPLDGSGASSYDLNPQGAQIPELKYVWHGFKDLTLEFDIGNGVLIKAHTLSFINQVVTETHLENPSLPMAVKIERVSGTGANLRILTGSWRGGVIAGFEENNSSNRWFAEWNINLPVVQGNWVHLATLRSKDLFQGKNNHIKTLVKLIASINSTNKDVLFAATRLVALDTADQLAIIAGFSDIDTLNSVIETSTAARVLTTQLTDNDLGDVAIVPRSDKVRNTDVQGLDLNPVEDIVFIGLPAANGDVSFQTNFKELH